MEKRIITLTTDFGLSDYYVGAMKGIIYQIAPETILVDITHEVPPQDVLAGAIILREIWRTYPPGTIHVAVIDPGVGSDRKIILVQFANQLFLVPDNGLITLIHQIQPPTQVNLVSNADLFCKPVSATFHGRDIFAPVAAHLAKGISPDQVGPRIEVFKLLDLPGVKISQNRIVGQVIYVDRFGNLMSNISADVLSREKFDFRRINIYVDGNLVGPLARTFSDVEKGKPLCYINSAGFVEIAINEGRADGIIGRKGSNVEIAEKS